MTDQVQTPDPEVTDTGDVAAVAPHHQSETDVAEDQAADDEFQVDYGHVPDGEPVTLSTAEADESAPAVTEPEADQ